MERGELITRRLTVDKQSTIQDTSSLSNNRDDMFNYQLALLEYGMLFPNFCDAVSKGGWSLYNTLLEILSSVFEE